MHETSGARRRRVRKLGREKEKDRRKMWREGID